MLAGHICCTVNFDFFVELNIYFCVFVCFSFNDLFVSIIAIDDFDE